MLGGVSRDILLGMAPSRTIQLLTNKVKTVSETAAPFNGGEIQGVNVHGSWIMSWASHLRTIGGTGLWGLQSRSVMDKGDLLSDFLLKMKVGGIFIPASNSGGDHVHGWTCCMIQTRIPVEKYEIRMAASLVSSYLAQTTLSLNLLMYS